MNIGVVQAARSPHDIGVFQVATLYNFLRRYEHTPATNTQLRM